ncbi:MAG: hypothetical protein KAS62_07550, partial [Candidatus Delongbacteria bacterium]|nr:hypothetical protein [Candidatus Delongbacteria bacterium]
DCSDDYLIIDTLSFQLLDMKVFLEGSYSGLQMEPYPNINYFPLSQPYDQVPWGYNGSESVAGLPNGNIVDWILVELRNTLGDASTANETTRVERNAAFLLTDGSIVDLDGYSNLGFDVTINNNLFVVIYHRNHLSIMNSAPLSETGGLYTYDFTTGVDKVYGSSLGYKEIGTGVWGMMGGDYDASGVIDDADKANGWNIEAGNAGYLNADYNLNGEVENIDKNDIWYENYGYEIQVPSLDTIWTCGDTLFDPRNGQNYSTVQIGDQCWMAENLNIGTRIDGVDDPADNCIIEKYCYDNDNANCNTCGGLYSWDEMMQYDTTEGIQGICPPGWHIPTDDEWKILEGTVDSQYPVGDPEWDGTSVRGFDAGLNLKSTSGWILNGNGTGLYGFTAL